MEGPCLQTSESSDSEDETLLVQDESSESEPDLECDKWDCKTTIIDNFICQVKCLKGCHLMPTCATDPSTQPANKHIKLAVGLRSSLTDHTFMSNFKNCYTNNTALMNNDVELLDMPFQACVISKFIENHLLLDDVRNEFNEVHWNKRSLDLYEFFQSADLKYVDSMHIQLVYEFLKTDVRNWVASITGLPLTYISATCSMYGHSDYLLTHDDQQDDRLVAFVLYLTDPNGWAPEDGGALQLLDKDSIGQPNNTVRDILPTNNQFVFFQVTNDSYHQVAEVTSKDHCRLSINGWFHTSKIPVFKAPPYTAPSEGLFGTVHIKPQKLDLDLDMWINSDYLDAKNIACIQKCIEDNSEISLNGYFRNGVFAEILETLKYPDITWTLVGPRNRCLYEVIDKTCLPHILSRFVSLFQSHQMFQLLRRYTELDLMTMRWEFQRWKPGCYSLLTDYDWNGCKELDLVLFLNCSNDEVIGGRIMYISSLQEVQHAFITLEPHQNNLNIVFRDTARISKYVSKCSRNKCFYVFICSYSE